MPTNVQIHRQVLLSNAKISKGRKTALCKLLQKYDTIMSKSDNDIGHIDHIEMHIGTRPDAAPVAAQPYTLALKHHDFLKHKIKNLLHEGIIHKSMSPWPIPIVVVKKLTPEGLPWQLHLSIDYRKLNSLIVAVTPAMGTKKGTFTLMPLPKTDELFALLKGGKYFTALDLHSGYYHIKLDEEYIPKVISLQHLANSNF